MARPEEALLPRTSRQMQRPWDDRRILFGHQRRRAAMAVGGAASLALLLALATSLLVPWPGTAAETTFNSIRTTAARSSPFSTQSSSLSGAAPTATVPASRPPPPNDMDYFVRVQNGRFVVGPSCKPFYVSGWNQWEAVEAAAGALHLYGAALPPNVSGPAMVRNQLIAAQKHGLNVIRAWAHTVSPPYALAPSAGVYNEGVWRGLDFLLDEARKHGVRLLLALTDNWQATGGADQFLGWAGLDVHEDFFSSPKAKALYKDHVRVLLERVNTINGRRYADDPTIFAFDLINEPRCYRCGAALEAWVAEMATWVKSIAPNILLTVGEEGFYPEEAEESQKAANPQGLESWAFWEGQHFVNDHAVPGIDFASIHLWVHNWEDATEDFAQRWLAQHVRDARRLGMPLLLEEFGAWGAGPFAAQRTAWYDLIYGIVAEDAKNGGTFQGALFWQWFAPGQVAPAEEGGGAGGLFGVFDHEETWGAVMRFTRAMQNLTAAPPAGWGVEKGRCAAAAGPVASPPPDCSFSRVDGVEGTGFEGAACDVDINECARGTHACSPHAACANTAGSYVCACFLGYEGNGRTCTPTTQLQALQKAFITYGEGRTACVEGADIVYPPLAPGYADDVLGALERHKDSPWTGGVGSRLPVGPGECAVACASARGCDSFSYNAEQRRCFLKSGASCEVCQKPATLCVSARGSPYSCGFWQTYFNATALGAREPAVVAADGPPGAAKPSLSAKLLGQHGARTRLQDLFTGASPSPKKILSGATRALKELDAGNLVLDVDGTQLLGKLLGQCVSKGGVTPDGLAAAAALAQIIQGPRKKKSAVTQALLTGVCPRALCDVVTSAAAGLSSGRLNIAETADSLKELLFCISHLCSLGFRRPADATTANADAAADGWGSQQDKASEKVRGRVLMASFAVPAVLDVLMLLKDCTAEDLEDYIFVSKTAAVVLANFLCGATPEGSLALATAPAAAAGAALDDVLSRCGDFLLQLDLCEAMYNCIKASVKAQARGGAAPATLHASSLFKPLKELVFQSERGEDVILSTELRQVLFDFNRRAGTGALVASLPPAAAAATVCGISLSFAPQSYVDLGQVSLSLSVMNESPEDVDMEPSQGGEVGSQRPVAPTGIDTLEIPYSTVSGCMISAGTAKGTVSLALQLNAMPEGLPDDFESAPSADPSRPLVMLTLRMTDLVEIKDKKPLVAARLEAAGVKMPSGEADLSQPGRPRKMSMAIAGRQIAPPAAPAPAPAAKAPPAKAKGSVKTSVLEQAERARADSRQGKAPGSVATAATAAAAPSAKAAAAPSANGNQRQWRTVKRDVASKPAAAPAPAAGSVKPPSSRLAPGPAAASDPIEDSSPDSPAFKPSMAPTTLLGVGETPLGGAAEDLEEWMAEPQPQAPLPSPLYEESDSDDNGEFAGQEAYEKGAAAARGEPPGAAAVLAGAAAALRAAKPAAADPKAPYKNPVQKKTAAKAVEEAEEGGKAAGGARRPAAAAAAAKGKSKPAAKQLKALAATGGAKKKATKPSKPPAKAAAAAAAQEEEEEEAPVERRQTRARAAAAAKATTKPANIPEKAKSRDLEASSDEEEDMPPAEEPEAPVAGDDGGMGFGGDEWGDGAAGMDLDYDGILLSQRQDPLTGTQEREERAAAAAAAAAAVAETKQPRADADAILGKRTPKDGAKKPRGGRMAALGGPSAAKKASPVAATAPAAAAAVPARTPARLQTETPAVAPGKKKDAGSDPVKAKKTKAAAAVAAPAVAPRQKRAAAQKAAKKLAEERAVEEEEEDGGLAAAAAAAAMAVASDGEKEEEEDAGWGAEEDEEEEELKEAPLPKQPSPRRAAPPRKKTLAAVSAAAAAAPAPKAPAAPKTKSKASKPAAPAAAAAPKAPGRAKKAPAKAKAPAVAPRPIPPPPAALAENEKEASDGESSEYSLHGSDTDSGAAGRDAQEVLLLGGGTGVGGTALLRRTTAAAASSDEEDDEDEVIESESEEEEEEEEADGDGSDEEAAARFALPPTTARALNKGKKQVEAAAHEVLHEAHSRGLALKDSFVKELGAGAAARLQEARDEAVGGVKEAEIAVKTKAEGVAQDLAANEAATAALLEKFQSDLAVLQRNRARLEAEGDVVMSDGERVVLDARKRGKKRLREAFEAVKSEVGRGKKRVKEIISEAVQEGQRAVLDMLNGAFYGVKQGAKSLYG